MKTTILSIFISLLYNCVFAQLNPTQDFETWTGSGANQEPKDWITGNQLVNPLATGNVQSVFRAQGGDVHGGAYAMMIVTTDVVTNPLPSVIPDPIGFVATGSATFFPNVSIKKGFPYTSRPANVEFWHKYSPSIPDTASFSIWLTKWNGVSRDTVAYGYWKTTANFNNAYEKVTVPLVYKSALITPDTAGMQFFATGTGCLTCGNVGSTLFVDDIVFSAPNDVNEISPSSGVTLYPNPASDRLNITVDGNNAAATRVYDATGRRVAFSSNMTQTSILVQRTGSIDVSSLPSGLYSYSVIDKNGNTINTGKFSIVK